MQRASQRAKLHPRVTSALMDPGAELNLVRAELLESLGDGKLRIHARENVDVALLNNGKHIGSVTQAVYLSLRLTARMDRNASAVNGSSCGLRCRKN